MNFFIFTLVVISASALNTEDAQTVRVANDRFAVDIYQQIIKTNPGNVINSPFSAEVVLALLDTGCKGSTAQQLSNGLHLPNNKQIIKSGMRSLLTISNSSILNTANGIFVQEEFLLKQEFEETAIDDFFAEIKNLDFSKNEEAAKTINEWVASKTNNTIKDLISPDVLNNSTRVVLVNAVHFLAKWLVQFPEAYTSKNNFYKSSSDVIQVDFMHIYRKYFNYYYCKKLQTEYLELLFQEEDASMIIILPKDVNGLPAYEKEITNSCMCSIPFELTYMNVEIPKFKFDNTIELTDILKELHVTKIFNPAEADLSGIAGNKGDLVVSFVLQKAFIDFNEGGVEASAATAVDIEPTFVLSQKPINFVANRPFLFLIVYQNVTIFTGKVTEPVY